MGKKVEWRYRERRTSGGSANEDIKTSPVQHGWKRTIQRIVVENETTADTEIRIGIIDQMRRIWWIAEQESNQAGVLYWINDIVVLQAQDMLLVRFTDSTENDVLGVYAYGFEEKDNPSDGQDLPQRGTGFDAGRVRTEAERGLGEPLTDAERAARHRERVG
ncbi:hypothetical protein ES703_104704 [subsurface metagenome]